MNLTLNEVRQALREEDVEGYIADLGTPDDEYDSEADAIYSAMQSAAEPLTTEKILSLIIPIWQQSFNHDDADMALRLPYLKILAERLETACKKSDT